MTDPAKDTDPRPVRCVCAHPDCEGACELELTQGWLGAHRESSYSPHT